MMRKNFRQLFLSLLPIIILCGLALGNVPESRMPYTSGKDLNGKPWTFPEGLPGERTLVLIGFDELQQQTIDSWSQGLGLDRATNGIDWVEMPLIDNPGMFMRWFIDTGMRGGIKDKDLRSHVWTAYTDKKAFMTSCGMTSDKEIYVLVVDRSGKILATASGEYSKEAAAKLIRALRK